MKSFPFLALLALLCLGGAKKPEVDLRIHGLSTAAEAPTFAFPSTLMNGQPVFLQRMPLLSQREVKAVYPFPAADGSYGIYLKIDNHGSRLLEQQSLQRRGSTLVVMLNGRQVSNLIIDRPISDGIVSIPEDSVPTTSNFSPRYFPSWVNLSKSAEPASGVHLSLLLLCQGVPLTLAGSFSTTNAPVFMENLSWGNNLSGKSPGSSSPCPTPQLLQRETTPSLWQGAPKAPS